MKGSSSTELLYKFNGKELDGETDLYYYGARYMNPITSLWYGVDLLAEKYPNVGAFVYCHCNPIKLIDPNGMDDYGIDEKGNITKLNVTEDDKNRLIVGAYKDENGNVCGLEYNKKGILKNSSMIVSKGILYQSSIKNDNLTDIEHIDEYVMNINYENEATNLFQFLSSNTEVEWSNFRAENIEDDRCYVNIITTSYSKIQDYAGPIFCIQLAKDGNFIKYYDHSHPFDSDAKPGTNDLPSSYDKNVFDQIRLLPSGKNCSFGIYVLGHRRDVTNYHNIY